MVLLTGCRICLGQVLADDNFATIVMAVGEGRRVWDNLVKILLYNMPVNFAQGLSVFFAYVVPGVETVPLTAIQVLYVNMITSVTMGLMLAMEPAEPSIMERYPYPYPCASRLVSFLGRGTVCGSDVRAEGFGFWVWCSVLRFLISVFEVWADGLCNPHIVEL